MIEAKIKELGYTLPEAPKPLAAYIPAIRVENASVSRMFFVLKSSPATLALSVTLIPPTIVSNAKGKDIGRYLRASVNP